MRGQTCLRMTAFRHSHIPDWCMSHKNGSVPCLSLFVPCSFHIPPAQRYKRSINIDSSPYGYDAEPTSPIGPSYESPLSFHPPSVADASQSAVAAGGALSTSPTVNPRKRPSQDQMEMMGRVESPAGSHPTTNMA